MYGGCLSSRAEPSRDSLSQALTGRAATPNSRGTYLPTFSGKMRVDSKRWLRIQRPIGVVLSPDW